MLQRILVPLDSSEFSKAVTRMAGHLALREEGGTSTVVGLGIVDLDQIPTGRFANVVPRDEIISEAERKTGELIAKFRQDIQELGLNSTQVETLRASGSPFRQIIRESVFCDLIVMGERCSFPPVNQDYETLHHLYHEASRPVLLTEGDFTTVDTVVMAMDGTAPSSRMMYNYVHLQPFPTARLALTYSRREEKQYHLEDYFQRVEKYLVSYGLDVHKAPFDGLMEEEIAGAVSREKAQVLALGVHREHFLDRLSDPLKLRQNFATRLLRSISASLFVVH